MSTRWGEAIQRLLNERKWTQKRLAEMASLRPNTLTNIIKHGKHTDTATLSRIARAFKVDLAELFTTPEQSTIMAAYHDNRIARVAETVMSDISARIRELVRTDYEHLQAEQETRYPVPRPLTAKRRKRAPDASKLR